MRKKRLKLLQSIALTCARVPVIDYTPPGSRGFAESPDAAGGFFAGAVLLQVNVGRITS
jgi:hypothetical protein